MCTNPSHGAPRIDNLVSADRCLSGIKTDSANDSGVPVVTIPGNEAEGRDVSTLKRP